MDTFLKFAAELFAVPADTISLDTAYESIPQWDSLAQLRLVAEMEETFGVEIPIDAVPDMKTLRDFYRYIDGEEARVEIPLSAPNLKAPEILGNLRECVESGLVSSSGRFIAEFERKVAAYVRSRDAVAVQSGAAGLHLALRLLGVQPGEAVIAPTLTFIAAVNPITYVGAEPVFMDCDDSLCLDPRKLERFCAEACARTDDGLIHRETGKRIRVILVVHVFGNMADMERIMDTADRYGLKVLEDATEALGSFYEKGRFAGKFAGTIGDAGVYSFNANKIITTGGGGMIVSGDQQLLAEARYLSATAKNDSLYFAHDAVGYNYRMLNIQAAIGVSQIDEIERFIETKRANHQLYRELLGRRAGIEVLPFSEMIRPNYWFYSLAIDGERFGEDRDALMNRLIAEGIQCRPVWKLCHTQKPYLDAPRFAIETAPFYERRILNVPCSTSLTAEDARAVCRAILK